MKNLKKSIIFDLDGTLWDTTEQVAIVWKEVARKYNIKIECDKITKIMGLTKNEIIRRLFKDNFELGNAFITECQNMENKYIGENGGKIYENTIKTIRKLYKEYDLFIVSNCQSGYIEMFLKYYKLEKYFKDYESSGNTGKDKNANIKIVLDRNNIKNAIYIGDTASDQQASQNNNLKFIWAKYGFGNCDSYDYYIDDIYELTHIKEFDL